MRIIDTHAHLYDTCFAEARAGVAARAKECGVEKIFLPNIDESTLPALLRMCAGAEGFFYPMWGLHPTEVRDDYAETLDRMEAGLGKGNFIGVGEVGLDFYWDRTYAREQKEAFVRQVELAVERGLPLMIHSRAAQRELVDLLSPYKAKGITGVFHCFGGTAEEARELLAFEGFMLGVNGVLTFKKSSLPDVLRQVPLTRLVVETDAPYLAPVPFRGKRNESAYLIYVVEKLAEAYGMPGEAVAEQTCENALKTFPLAGEWQAL